MVERVFWHIGLPKTGTTYLQRILWSNRETLARDGVTMPGDGHRQHLWAALDLQENPRLARRHADAPGTWERLADELDRSSGTGLLTHEFFCGATREQVQAGLERLGSAEVHVVITARDAHGMLTAGWQELVKNGSRLSLPEAAAGVSSAPEFSWQTWDLHGVLERWAPDLPPEQVHVIPMPSRQDPPDTLWHRFASVLGLGGDYALPEESVNRSLGVVQVELLRRVNAHLSSFSAPVDRGEWIRGELAEGHLSRQSSERFGVPPEVLADCRVRSQRAVDLIRSRGIDVQGDVASLLVPDGLGVRRQPESVTDAELLDASGELVATMLERIRDLSRAPERDAGPRRGVLSRVRSRLERS